MEPSREIATPPRPGTGRRVTAVIVTYSIVVIGSVITLHLLDQAFPGGGPLLSAVVVLVVLLPGGPVTDRVGRGRRDLDPPNRPSAFGLNAG